jgi:hypothetical protein
VSVSGNVTLNGAVLPDQTSSRGQITFRGSTGVASLSVDLGTTGAKSYSVRLPPGTYDVSYGGVGGSCSTTSTSAMPCGSGTLVRGVGLTADGNLDLNIPVVTVTGRVTLKGATVPDQTRSRGSLTFRGTTDTTIGATTSAFASTGDVTYKLNLIPGTYDVVYSGDPIGCTQTASLPAIPCNSGAVKQNVALTTSGVLDVDVPMVKVAGAVTLNGAPMPDATVSRGSLSFAAPGGSAISTASFGSTGSPTYAVALIPGSYGVSLAANANLCGPTLTPQVPCLGGVLMPAIALTADGVLNLDIHAVAVTGSVTLNGQPLPAASGSRGGVTFTSTTGSGGGTYAMLGTSGAATYRVTMLAGTYDVDYAANQTLCGGTITPALPCTGGPIARGLGLTVDGVLDADVKRVMVTGRVTARGATMPTASASRGSLLFVRADGASLSTASLGTSGEATYALSLWPGVYDARLSANSGLCVQGTTAPAVPCVGGLVHAAAPLQTDGVLDVDISPVMVSGNVTLNGAALPAETLDRGSIGFARVAGEGGGGVSFSLGTNAAASYGLTLTAGNYIVSHGANSGLCAPSRALPGVACASQTVVGCTTH